MRLNRPPALPFIFMTLLIDMLGVGVIIPLLPELVTELTGRLNLLLGTLSDRSGRRAGPAGQYAADGHHLHHDRARPLAHLAFRRACT